MIRPALHICRESRLETAAVVFSVALALLIPAFFAMAWAASNAVVPEWLESYEPVVYLEGSATDAQAEALVEEIEGWASVGEVKLRSPAAAHKDLVERLGEEAVIELGVRPSMLPKSIVISPATDFGGHIDLIPSAAALEARMEVDAVEVPDDSGVRILMLSGIFSVLALIASLLAVAAIAVILGEYLRRLLERESDVNDALELFGAPPSATRRPTLIRGAALGGWAGGMCTVFLLSLLFVVQGFVSARLGVQASMAMAWPVAFAPTFFGAFLGAFVGFWISGPTRRPSELAPAILGRWAGAEA